MTVARTKAERKEEDELLISCDDISTTFHVTIASLYECLNVLSHGDHQWRAVPINNPLVSSCGEQETYVLIGYSNPDPTKLPNHLFCLVPSTILRSSRSVETDVLVEISSLSMTPLANGLYFEDGLLLYDPMTDWFAFWGPLTDYFLTSKYEEMILNVPPLEQLVSDLSRPAATDFFFRRSLRKRMEWLAGNTWVLQEALDA